jgi:hypothetical protein
MNGDSEHAELVMRVSEAVDGLPDEVAALVRSLLVVVLDLRDIANDATRLAEAAVAREARYRELLAEATATINALVDRLDAVTP